MKSVCHCDTGINNDKRTAVMYVLETRASARGSSRHVFQKSRLVAACRRKSSVETDTKNFYLHVRANRLVFGLCANCQAHNLTYVNVECNMTDSDRHSIGIFSSNGKKIRNQNIDHVLDPSLLSVNK